MNVKHGLLVAMALSIFVSLQLPRGVTVTYSEPDEQHVYYAYIPPSVVNLSRPIISVGDVVVETMRNYTSFPSNLDVVGCEDGTSYQLYDLGTKALLRSGSLNKYQHVRVSFGSRKTSTEPFEVQDYYIKLAANKPVSALVWGGFIWGIPGFDRPYPENKTINGFASFIPSVDGGFIGREFIFLTFPTYWEPMIYINEVNMYNIFALRDSKVAIYDAAGILIQELDVGKLTMARTSVLDPWKVHRITSTGNIMVFGTSLNSMTYAPALTGGYVGKTFFAMKACSVQSLQSFLAVGLEDAKIEMYDTRKPAGSAAEKALTVKQSEMVFDTSLQWNIPVLMKSTENVTLLVGGNRMYWGATNTAVYGYVKPQYISGDVALLGARAGQEVGFYAPYQAIIFAAGDTDIEVNGIPRNMKKDEYVVISSGVSTVKPMSAPAIVEILGNVNLTVYSGKIVEIEKGFYDWGHYLISSQTLYKAYQPVEEGGGMETFVYVGIGIGVIAAVILVFALTRRRKA